MDPATEKDLHPEFESADLITELDALVADAPAIELPLRQVEVERGELPNANIFSEFGSGVEQAGASMASMIAAGAGMAADAGLLGEEKQKDAGLMMQEAARYQQLGAEVGPQTQFKDIENPGDVFNYAFGLLGAFLPDIGMMAASGGASAIAKRGARELAESMIQKEVASQVAKGATREAAESAVAATLKASLQNPETLKNLGTLGNWVAKGGLERAAGKGVFLASQGAYSATRETTNNVVDIYNETGEIDSGTAMKYGIPAGLVDAVGDTIFGGKLFGAGRTAKEAAEEVGKRGAKGVIRDTARGAAKGALVEAPTEAFQEGLGIASVKEATNQSLNPLNWEKGDYDRLIEGAAGGAILGGMLGGLGGAGGERGVNERGPELSKRYSDVDKAAAARGKVAQNATEQVKSTAAAVDNVARAASGLEDIQQNLDVPTEAMQRAAAAITEQSIKDTEAEIEAEVAKAAQAEVDKITKGAAIAQPERPTQATPATAEKIAETKPATTAPKLELPVQATPAENPTAPVSRPKLPGGLAGAKPRYKERELTFDDDIDRAAYIVANEKNTSRANERYLEFGEQNGYSREELIAHGKKVREEISNRYRATKGGGIRIEPMSMQRELGAQAAVPAAETEDAPDLGIPTPEESIAAAQDLATEEEAVEVQEEVSPEVRVMPGAQFKNVPVENITLSREVPQFKRGKKGRTAPDPETGVVDPIAGPFKRYPDITTKPIMLWERLNGDIEVVSGRHRLDNARRNKEATIPSQIWKEEDGYTAADMAFRDAQDNILDEKGEVEDYAKYLRQIFRGVDIAEARAKAEAEGLLSRAKGRNGFAIGVYSSDPLWEAVSNGKIRPTRAAIIAEAAPLDDDVQIAAMAETGMPDEQIPGFIAFISANGGSRQALQQLTMFDMHESFKDAGRELTKIVTKRQNEINDRIKAVKGAVANPEAARSLKVDVSDPEVTKQMIAELEAELERLSKVYTDRDLQEELLGRKIYTPERSVELTPEEAAAPIPTIDKNGEGNLFAGDEIEFNLFGEEDTTPLLQKEADDRAAAEEAKRIADENQLDMFAEAKPESTPTPIQTAETAKLEAKIEALTADIENRKATESGSFLKLATLEAQLDAAQKRLDSIRNGIPFEIELDIDGMDEAGKAQFAQGVLDSALQVDGALDFEGSDKLDLRVTLASALQGKRVRSDSRTTVTPKRILSDLADKFGSIEGAIQWLKNTAAVTTKTLKTDITDEDVIAASGQKGKHSTVTANKNGKYELDPGTEPYKLEPGQPMLVFESAENLGFGFKGRAEIKTNFSVEEPTGRNDKGGNPIVDKTTFKKAIVITTPSGRTDDDGNPTFDTEVIRIGKVDTIGNIQKVWLTDGNGKAVIVVPDEGFSSVYEARKRLKAAAKKETDTKIITKPEKPLFARTGPAVEIKATPSIGRGKEHFARIKSAVEAVARLYPGRKMRLESWGSESQDIRYSNTDGQVEAYYDPATNEMVFVTDNIRDEVRAAQLFMHEATEGNLSKINATPEGKAKLDSVFERIKAVIAKETPALLKEAGYGSVQELADAYGYDLKTREGKRSTQWELVARFAERIAADPNPPVWWKRMLSDLKLWFKETFNISMSAADLESFLRKELSKPIDSVPGISGARILPSKKAVAKEVTEKEARKLDTVDLAQESDRFKGLAEQDSRFTEFSDILQAELERRAIRADRPDENGKVVIDKSWAVRCATTDAGVIDVGTYSALLEARTSDGNAVYVQGGKRPVPIAFISENTVTFANGESIPTTRLLAFKDTIETRKATPPPYKGVETPGNAQIDPENIPTVRGLNVSGEPTPDGFVGRAAQFANEKVLRPVIGVKGGAYAQGGLFSSGIIPPELRKLVNSKNDFVADAMKQVEMKWNAYNDALKKAGLEPGKIQALVNTALGNVIQRVSPEQNSRAEFEGRKAQMVYQAQYIRDNHPQHLNAIGRLDTQSKKNAYLRDKLNAAQYNAMNSRMKTAHDAAVDNTLGAFRKDNYNTAMKAKADARAQLPNEVVDALEDMNQAMNELIAYGVNKGLLSDRMAAAVADAPGLYLIRSYRLIDDPDFRAQVKDRKVNIEEVDKLSTWIYSSLITKKAKEILAKHNIASQENNVKPSKTMADARVEALPQIDINEDVKPLLTKILDVRYEDEVFSILDDVMGEKSKDMGLPQEVADAWGVYLDPGVTFGRTMQRVSQNIAKNEMDKGILAMGTEMGFIVDPKAGGVVPSGFVEIATRDKYTMPPALKPFEGMWTTPEFREFFTRYYAPPEAGMFMNVMARSALVGTLAKTVYSPTGAIRNLVSNAPIAFTAGHAGNMLLGGGFFNGLSVAWASMRGRGSKAVAEYISKLVRLGILSDNVGPSMLKHIMGYANNVSDAEIDADVTNSMLNPGAKRGVVGFLKNVNEKASRIYGMMDEIWKVNGFEAEVKKIKAYENWREAQDAKDDKIPAADKFLGAETMKRKAKELAAKGQSAEAKSMMDAATSRGAGIEKQAADFVRDVYPTYSMAPEFVKKLKAVPAMGQFATFAAEMIRNTTNVAKISAEKIKTGDDYQKAQGWMMLGRLAVALVAPVGLEAVSKMLTGISDEEEDAIREALPPYRKNAMLIFLGKDSDTGEVRFLDTTAMNPYAYVLSPIKAALRSIQGGEDTFVETAARATWGLFEPFIGVDITTGNVIEIIKNDKGGGSRVYNPEDPDAWMDWTKHILKGVEPGFSTLGRNLYGGATGEKDMSDELMAALAFRPIVSDPIKALGFAGWQSTKRLKDANSLLLKELYAGGDIGEVFTKANAARYDIMKDVWRQYHGGITRGAKRSDLDKKLKDLRFSKDQIRQIQNGYVEPYAPGKQTRKSLEKATAEQLDGLIKSSERVYFDK